MNIQEISEIFKRIKANWQSFKPDDSQTQIWFEELEKFELAKALEVVRDYGLEGSKFAPTLYELVRRIESKNAQSQQRSKGFKEGDYVQHALQQYQARGLFIVGYDHPCGFAYSIEALPKGVKDFRRIGGELMEVWLVG
jgi:hypothetical protein